MKFANALEAWQAANEEVRVAENVLIRMWQDYLDGRGRPPSRELIEEVEHLRQAANDALAEAVRVIGPGKN